MTFTRNAWAAVVAVLATLAVVAVLMFVPTHSAGASNEPCVPKDAYTEVVVVTPAVPAIPAVPGTPAIPGVPAVPAVPGTDPVYETVVVTPAVEATHYSWNGGNRGVDNPPTVVPPHADWQVQGVGFDPHLQGNGDPATWYPVDPATSGLHVVGNSPKNASWFYFVPGKDAVTEDVLVTPGTEGTPEIPAIPAVPATDGTPAVPAVPAVTKDVFHPAVVCVTPTETVTTTVVPPVVTETVVPTPTPDDVQTPDVVEVPDKEETPVSTPDKDKPVVTVTENCVGDSLVTKTFKDGVAVSTSSVPNKDCADEVIRTTGEPTQEEGL